MEVKAIKMSKEFILDERIESAEKTELREQAEFEEQMELGEQTELGEWAELEEPAKSEEQAKLQQQSEAAESAEFSEQAAGGAAKKDRLWTAPYITLVSLGAFISMSFYMVMPLLAKYAVQMGASIPAAGVVVGMFSIIALFARPVSGIISDRINKKYVFVAATAFIGLSLIGYSVSAGIASLIAFRAVHAVAFSVNGTVNLALVAQLIPKSRIGEGIGYFGLGQIIATAAGPNLGLYIGERYGLSASFLTAGAIMLTASAVIFMLPFIGQKGEKYVKAGMSGHTGKTGITENAVETEQTKSTERTEEDEEAKLAQRAGESGIAENTEKSGKSEKTKPGLRIADFIAVQVLPLAFFGSVFSMFNGVIGSYLVLLGDERGIDNISLYFTVNALALIFVRLFAGRIYDRYGLSAVMLPAFVLAAVAALFIGYAQALPIILAASVLKAFAQGSAQPTIQAECIKLLPEEKSGVATSTYYIGADIGQGFGPMLAGAIASEWNYEVMFTACAGIFVAALLLYRIRLRLVHRAGAN